nr:hypothetical protein [uncultured Desulfuromonas sp.]
MRIILIVLISLISSNVWANSPAGLWVWDKNNSSRTFSIRIDSGKNELLGSYCAVALSGHRIDCSSRNNKKFSVWLDGREFEFWTNYSGKPGIATLEKVGHKIHWIIVKQPDGEHYAPTEAWLSKYEPQNKR